MGAQDLNQEHAGGDLLEIKTNHQNMMIINSCSMLQKLEAKRSQKQQSAANSAILMKSSSNRRRNNIPTRKTAAIKMIRRRRARRAGQEGSRKCSSVVVRKIRTLKKLVPNAGSSVGLDGLFRETAEYISSLQMRVRMMKAVVDALSNTDQ